MQIKISHLEDANESLKEQNKALKDRLDASEGSRTAVPAKAAKNSNNWSQVVKSLTKKGTKPHNELLAAIDSHMKEQSNRAKNVVVVGVPLSTKNTEIARMANDEAWTDRILHKLGVVKSRRRRIRRLIVRNTVSQNFPFSSFFQKSC
ncbi:hypothetical protein BpHYR1_009954 [Brachionus plicatilis]|uniref:Uncharacterized protein n=1 Tax=Brachionus plicatilis TaxID=10195 RepID=A0A3M7QJF7_BRAPC|nr:hypothetical protein BpHYR1_009954 [Brachionus plicatilis]